MVDRCLWRRGTPPSLLPLLTRDLSLGDTWQVHHDMPIRQRDIAAAAEEERRRRRRSTERGAEPPAAATIDAAARAGVGGGAPDAAAITLAQLEQSASPSRMLHTVQV